MTRGFTDTGDLCVKIVQYNCAATLNTIRILTAWCVVDVLHPRYFSSVKTAKILHRLLRCGAKIMSTEKLTLNNKLVRRKKCSDE